MGTDVVRVQEGCVAESYVSDRVWIDDDDPLSLDVPPPILLGSAEAEALAAASDEELVLLYRRAARTGDQKTMLSVLWVAFDRPQLWR